MDEPQAPSFQHQTVLLKEAVDALAIKEDGLYIDATFGRGGHSRLILEKLSADGRLLLIDKDPEAICHAQKKYADDARILIWQGSFKDFPLALEEFGVEGKIDGLLLDLGVSSPQLDDASRGFSFQRDGALDMRMNPDAGQSAAEWLASAEEDEIATVLWKFGDERFSRRIARAILRERELAPIETTLKLASIIAGAIPRAKQKKGKNPATKSFQAIRIFINKELDDLELCLQRSMETLSVGGRIAIISFHSLEDRMVKRFFKDKSSGPKLPRGFPVMDEHHKLAFKIIGKPIKASKEELEVNARSRSAIMRIGEKLT
ncbi:MAG: 16S rRNA (cytosine(1402)-N(4))-methyltransferase [Aquificaceae bacterium]|nr:MAG: 16S rRNA (cytosine(1402)-N(4))-methyltransferase [Aquificaceae bacterium]